MPPERFTADPAPPPAATPGAGMNRLQRAYFRWAEPYYLRLPPESRADARRLDEFLYSRRGLFLWLGWFSAVGASAAGLVQSGMPWSLALLCSGVVWGGILPPATCSANTTCRRSWAPGAWPRCTGPSTRSAPPSP